MASKVRRVDYSPDEYVTGVGGVLRADEQGIYWMICTLVMSSGGAFTRNDQRIASLCLIRQSDACRITDKLIAMGKIEALDGGKLTQKRARSEVERSVNRIQIATENGSKGGRPAKKDEVKQETVKPDGLFSEKLSLTNNEQLTEETDIRPKPAKRRLSYSPKFEEFWKAYPTDALMSKKEAGTAFEKLEPEQQDQAIASIPAFRAHCSSHVDYRPVHAVRYITQGRFEGFLATSAKLAEKMFVELDSPTWKELLKRRGVSSMAHSENNGKRGWWFPRREIEGVPA